MSVRVTCPNCQQLLEVPDVTAGQEALCPQCETVFTITDQAQSESRPVGTEVPVTGDPSVDMNPFAAPQTGDPTDRMYGKGTPSADSIPVEPGAIFTCAFELWKQHWGILVAMTTVVWVINVALQQTMRWLALFGLAMAEVPEVWSPPTLQLVSAVASIPLLYLQVGVTIVILKLLRGQPATFGEMFWGCGNFGSLLVAMMPFGLGLILGTVFCVVPGVFVWLVYWPCFYLAVDGRQDVMTRSKQLTKGHLLIGLQLSLIATGLYVVGFLACCVGIVIPASLVSVMWATAYVAMLEESHDSVVEPSA